MGSTPLSTYFTLASSIGTATNTLYLSYTALEPNSNVLDFFRLWDDSTTTGVRGFIKLQETADPDNWGMWYITGGSSEDAGSSTISFPISLSDYNGSFGNTDTISIDWDHLSNHYHHMFAFSLDNTL